MRKPKLNNLDLRSLRRHCIKNRHSSISDITTWAQDYFGKPLSSTTISSYIHKCQFKLYCAKRKPYVNSVQSAVDFSGLGGISNATRDSVLLNLRSVERRLLKDPEKAETYQAEMSRLLETGPVCVVPDPVPDTSECWYIPHYIVSHNGKSRLVFNCSHQYRGQSLNQYLLPDLPLEPRC